MTDPSARSSQRGLYLLLVLVCLGLAWPNPADAGCLRLAMNGIGGTGLDGQGDSDTDGFALAFYPSSSCTISASST